jgi:HPt (histidine-containing phosphotransfer) domain-containing protein
MAKTSYVTREMRLKYLERRTGELTTSIDKLAQKDFAYFKSIGHQIKGNAVTFDFPELTEFGVSLERLAEASDLAGISEVLNSLKLSVQNYLDRIENEKPDI